jgi:hypothetical protein
LGVHSNGDHPIEISDFGKAQSYYKDGQRRYFELDNYLPVMWENQGCCTWAVKLDGSDDPPVYICEGQPEPDSQWLLNANSFSEYTYAQVWDFRDWFGPCYLLAIDVPASQADLQFLRENFQENIQTWNNRCKVTYRFGIGNKRLTIMYDSEIESQWELFATTKTELLELTQLIWHCSTLATQLDDLDNSRESREVLNTLRSSEDEDDTEDDF